MVYQTSTKLKFTGDSKAKAVVLVAYWRLNMLS